MDHGIGPALEKLGALALIRRSGRGIFHDMHPAGRGLVLLAFAAVAFAACDDSTPEKLRAAQLSEGCSINSDCKDPYVCVFERCHQACKEDRDCDHGERCVAGDADQNVCQLEVETSCKAAGDCKGHQICAADLECHDPCTKDDDCIADQICAKMGACASSDPTRDRLDSENNLVPGSAANGTGGAGGAGTGGASGAQGTGGATTDAAPPDSGSGGVPDGGPGSDGGAHPDAGGPACSGTGLARFRPSNLPDAFVVPAGAPSYTHAAASCHFETDDDTSVTPAKGPRFTCPSVAGMTAPEVVTMRDSSEAAVLPLDSLVVPAGVTLTIQGRRPVILVVNGDVTIHGSIVAAAGSVSKWFSGGAPSRTSPHVAGICPVDTEGGAGGGSPGSNAAGAGGGAFCGAGGNGLLAGTDAGIGVAGGATYGAASLVPLVGGSSGGTGNLQGSPESGHGGGAIEIVAGGSILVSETGVIDMGGGAGFDSASGVSAGYGGGSGGGILLEAPSVTVKGILAANGGAGSYRYLAHAQSGSANDQPALSGGKGGEGAAGATVDGGDGANTTAGGGGAGRIRINTGCGGALTVSQTAIVSPRNGTGCYTSGGLR